MLPYDTETGYGYLSLEQYRASLALRYKKAGLELRAQTDLEPVFPESTPIPLISTGFSEMQDQETRNLHPWLTAHSKPLCSISRPAGRHECPQKAGVY